MLREFGTPSKRFRLQGISPGGILVGLGINFPIQPDSRVRKVINELTYDQERFRAETPAKLGSSGSTPDAQIRK